MGTAVESLFGCLAEIRDPRKARGIFEIEEGIFHQTFYTFQAILRLTLLGLVSGQTTMAHIALFGEKYWPRSRQRQKRRWVFFQVIRGRSRQDQAKIQNTAFKNSQLGFVQDRPPTLPRFPAPWPGSLLGNYKEP